MARYRVGALVSSMIYDEFDADNEEQAKEMMCDKYGDMSITLCAHCSTKIDGLSVSENTEDYEVEEINKQDEI
ncbi:hypothetical protein SAMN05443270_3086 [Lacrimispora sphenoides]|uniref:hypothetical protein n=1 Tax=Lacrimispora sphenoides TaxID=29370 RepID=UPI0008CAE55F|nr:hypothetical protein [Lacrimispora sphenoides]SEU09364.1 hypothetical protein SAMN05443270_3086 [Lacrimispora sphenoides]